MEIALEFCDQDGKEIYWILRPDWRTDSYTESFHQTLLTNYHVPMMDTQAAAAMVQQSFSRHMIKFRHM